MSGASRLPRSPRPQHSHSTDEARIVQSTVGGLESLKNIEKLALNVRGTSPYLIPALQAQPRLKLLPPGYLQGSASRNSCPVFAVYWWRCVGTWWLFHPWHLCHEHLLERHEKVRSYFSCQTASLLAVRSKLPAKESPTRKRQKTRKSTLLPYDIILVVVEFLDERSTARLVQTCRHFRDLIEPVLYRHIRVLRSDEETLDPLKGHLLHRTLAKRPDLLPFVLSYHGPLKPDVLALQRVAPDEPPTKRKSRWFKAKAETQHPPEKVPTSEEVLKPATAIFRGMINLRDVHFTDQIIFRTIVVLDSLKNIERLALNIGGYSPFLIYALRTQPRLKHLELNRAVPLGSVRFQSTDVQELKSLKARLFEASEIVPGRPIETLELLDDYSWTYRGYSLGVAENLFKNLTRSACEITNFTNRFGCSGNDETVARYLQLVVRYLPSIERLCISSRHALSDSLLLEILPAVSSLRRLKMMGPVSREKTDVTTVLHETQQLQDDIPLYFPEDFGHFVRRLKGHCHGLIEVEWCRSETFHCSAEGEIPFRYRAVE